MRLLSVFAFCLLVALPSFADNTADESDIAFALGNQHYAKRDYERALQQYFLSWRLVPNRNVLFNIARCYEALGRFDEAYRYFSDLSKDTTLPASDARDVRAALARLGPKVALLSVDSTPAGASLYVDREDLGTRGETPQTVAVSPGHHTVLLKLAGHVDAQAKVSASRGREAKTSLTLKAIVGTVSLSGTPAGAVVRESADGPELGRLPATLSFTPGQRLLVVQAPGYIASQVLVEVKADAPAEVTVALQEKPKPTGKVVVTANRDSALVRVDGKDSGFTPVVLTLVEGPHTIEVTTAEVTPFVQSFTVAHDSETRLHAELRYAPPKIGAASKSLLSVDDAPASVTVLTREELQGFGYQTVAEALQAVRGFFLSDDRIYTYTNLRGFSPPGDLNTRIAVLWDGHPMSDAWAGQGFLARDLDVDLAEVERIEIVRGPASILFGTGAVFGVVNVVPRDTLAAGRNVEGSAGTGHVGGVKARVTTSVGQGDTSALLSAAGFLSSGAETTDLGAEGLQQGQDGERTLGATARGKLGGFTFSAKVNQRRKQVPVIPAGAQFNVPGTEATDARGFVEVRYEKTLGRVSLSGRGSYDASRYRAWYASLDELGVRRRTTEIGGADWFAGEARAALTLFEGNRLTVAVEGSGQASYQQPDAAAPVDRRTRLVLSATALDEWQVFSRLFLQAGLRVDWYSDVADPALSPRLALVARPYTGGLTKAVVGQAFRAPNIYEQYYNDLNLSIRAADPLRPETITTFELEHSHDVTPELRVSVGGYHNLIDRLVVIAEEDVSPPACGAPGVPEACLVFGNLAQRGTATGAEAQLRWQPGRFTLVEANYAFVVLGGSGATEAPFYPSHVASLKALVPLNEGFVRLSGQATYQSPRRVPGGQSFGEAVLLNLGLSGDVGNLRYFAGVRNALDVRYALPLSNDVQFGVVPQYGRTFWLEVTAGF